MTERAWAIVDTDGIVISVQIASEEWINANPATPNVWHDAAEGTPGYAGIGFTYDSETGWYIPPVPDYPGTWVFDRDQDVWRWVNTDVSPDALE